VKTAAAFASERCKVPTWRTTNIFPEGELTDKDWNGKRPMSKSEEIGATHTRGRG
jgi:hypothetical protein